MSGGVDSSVTARLLANEDYDLSAVFMRNWDTRDESATDQGCEWEKDWEDVQRVCRMLGLPCKMVSAFIKSEEYWNLVFEPSLRLWEQGETPNPDILCNREVKFGALMDRLHPTKAQWLATGHYAGVDWEITGPDNPRPKLVRALDPGKDQSFYLSAVTESSLRKVIFPLRYLRKESVRQLAHKYGLPTATRGESMGLCFIGEKRKFDNFISEYIPPNKGEIIDLQTGKRVGTHSGLWHYTIGQGAKIPGAPERMFVAQKNPHLNQVVVVPGSRHPALSCDGLAIRNFKWIWSDAVPPAVDTASGLFARVQYRHRMQDVECTVKRRPDGIIEIIFNQPESGIAPGQVAAVYDGNWCLGSGTITQTISSI